MIWQGGRVSPAAQNLGVGQHRLSIGLLRWRRACDLGLLSVLRRVKPEQARSNDRSGGGEKNPVHYLEVTLSLAGADQKSHVLSLQQAAANKVLNEVLGKSSLTISMAGSQLWILKAALSGWNAHRDEKRFIVRADEKLTCFVGTTKGSRGSDSVKLHHSAGSPACSCVSNRSERLRPRSRRLRR